MPISGRFITCGHSAGTAGLAWCSPPGLMPTLKAFPHACLQAKWAARGVLARFTALLTTYADHGLSWAVLNQSSAKKDWEEVVNRALTSAFATYCNESAVRYDHPPIRFKPPAVPKNSKSTSPMQPYLRHCFEFGGDLACVALRIRHPRLRLLPSFQREDHGVCRCCGYGKRSPENGLHLFFCSRIDTLRPGLCSIRDDILDAIALESRHLTTKTRCDRSTLEQYVMDFTWPHQSSDLLKRLLVFCRNLVNAYASYHHDWERNLETYPVRRVRPSYRRAAHAETIPSDLRDLQPPHPSS